MRPHRLQIIGATENGEQHGIRHKVESREGAAFVVQIARQRLEADLQLSVDVPQYHALRYFLTIATLQTVHQ
jgi:hypothetical protein